MFAEWLDSIRNVYWVTRFLLNGIVVVLNVAELSQGLANLYAAWFFSIWTVYWVSRVLLKDILVVWNVVELTWSVCKVIFSIWTVYWVTRIFSTELYIGCLECWRALTELCAGWHNYLSFGWVDYYWTVNWVALNVAELSQVLAELYARSSKLSTAWLNCLLHILNVAEQSQALADLYTGWFCSTELSTGWMDSCWTI